MLLFFLRFNRWKKDTPKMMFVLQVREEESSTFKLDPTRHGL
jgi:hypothetical protein